ncbi:MAG: hypothetical protein WC687_04460 [Patescibacteria group bacterium]|jgi:hypothetical protein
MKTEDIPNMEQFLEIGFTFKGIPYEDNPDGKLYLLYDGNREKAESDILTLNKYMDIAQERCSSIGPNRIEPSKFSYARKTNELNNFIFFKVKPYTPTGKPSKYPLVLYFNQEMLPMGDANNDQVFGEIQYLKNSSIGAVKIIQWYKGSLKIITLAQKNNELVVSSIEASEKGERIRLYKQ